MYRIKLNLVVLFLLLAAQIIVAEKTQVIDSSWVNDETNCTVITSESLSFNQKKQVAVFSDNVVVTDPQVQIHADRLTVLFSEANQIVSLEGYGNVVIEKDDKKGFGSKATYVASIGTIVLTGSPRIERGQDILSGEIITFYRNTGRLLCEPNAMFVLYSDDEASAQNWGGE